MNLKFTLYCQNDSIEINQPQKLKTNKFYFIILPECVLASDSPLELPLAI
jgi:hypothetical protein